MHYRTALSYKFRLEYFNNPNRCKQCDGKLEFDQRTNKFCSRECIGLFYTIENDSIKKVVVDGQTKYKRNCPTCKKSLYHTRKLNAIRLLSEGCECRSCSKTNPPKTTTKKRIASFKKTIARLRKLKNY